MQTSPQHDQISSTARLVLFGQVLLGQDKNWSHLIPEQTVICGKHWLRVSGGSISRLVPLTHHSWFQRLAHLLQNITIPGLFLHQALRKRYIDEQVRSLINNDVQQVVVVGGGLDTLSLRIASQFPHVRCFELDRAGTQRIKQSTPELMPDTIHLIPADLDETTLDRVLRAQDAYDARIRTAFVVEGVSMYLEQETVRTMLNSISSLADDDRHELIMTFMDGRPESCSFHNATALADLWLEMKGEPFRWGCPREEISIFMRESDLILQDLQDHETLRERYLDESTEATLARGELITHASVKKEQNS